jgi:hypothetical protein
VEDTSGRGGGAWDHKNMPQGAVCTVRVLRRRVYNDYQNLGRLRRGRNVIYPYLLLSYTTVPNFSIHFKFTACRQKVNLRVGREHRATRTCFQACQLVESLEIFAKRYSPLHFPYSLSLRVVGFVSPRLRLWISATGRVQNDALSANEVWARGLA